MKSSSASTHGRKASFCITQAVEYEIGKQIGTSRVSVYEVSSKKSKEKYAMKIFPYLNDEVDACFISTARFSPISHPNIISIVDAQEEVTLQHKNKISKCSYIVMELAPLGDFTAILGSTHFSQDEKLVRTYFHQLIGAIEFLHSNKIYHLDIKPDNMLLGKDFNLKLTDFDSSYVVGDEHIRSRGTKHYRAKEVKENRVLNPAAADIFSAGVCLFVLTAGCLPFLEDDLVEGVNLYQLAQKQRNLFWDTHKKLLGDEVHFSLEFKALFLSMIKEDPSERPKIEQIKRSAWYKGPVYSATELPKRMTKLLKEAKLL